LKLPVQLIDLKEIAMYPEKSISRTLSHF